MAGAPLNDSAAMAATSAIARQWTATLHFSAEKVIIESKESHGCSVSGQSMSGASRRVSFLRSRSSLLLVTFQ